ncbi:MAG: hypothetical protein HY360_10685 [Verrucomicrobia bacterium]|nr:hypothetical protein [Verrucomicrobiota bacterium]
MSAIAQTLEKKLQEWPPATAQKVEQQVSELIVQADAESANGGLKSKTAEERSRDPLFADTAVWHGPAPKDSSVNHDKYLYGDDA